ncbi:PREDICTED: uncharacterized protein LOC18587906 [Theobroma cacao]|uniref:Uncharacterized protein LOC18587906 n=2 Tax=Theobroma cacao TaxID=3641 RepID=A0AB32UNQ9_THECC|nr:PREDICTED: uncharacterized protein LOC18587906 [Theobroma cacao]EOY29636.1 Uncharacterized protein TCM_037123 [Theobroma cacao]
MATAILLPEECVGNRLRHETLSLARPLRSRGNPNPNTIKPKSGNDGSSSRGRKRSSARFQSNNRRQSESMVVKSPGKNLVMGQVKILKRGEKLIPVAEKTNRGRIHGSSGEEESDLALGSTNRLGPDPETMQKQIKVKEFKIRNDLFAGSNFVSPPPSSLPVPGFLGKTERTSS